MPFIIPKNYFNYNEPNRDLIISPDHAIEINDIWIKPKLIRHLKKFPGNNFTYYNLKLPDYHKHNLICNNLVAESWDDGDENIKKYKWINKKKYYIKKFI